MKGSARQPTSADVLIGSQLAIRRRSLHISQRQLACQCGIASMQLARYERGTGRIPAARLALLAKLLDVPLSYFFVRRAAAPDKDHALAADVQELNAAYQRIADAHVRRAVLAIIVHWSHDTPAPPRAIPAPEPPCSVIAGKP